MIGLLNQDRLSTASLYATRYAVPRSIDFVLKLFNPGKDVVEKRLQALVDEYSSLYLNLGMRPKWNQIAGHFDAVGVVFNDRKLNTLVVDISPQSNSRGAGLASQAIQKIIDQLSLAANTANSEQRALPDIQFRYVGAKASDPGAWIVVESLAENPGMLNALASLHLGFTKFGQAFRGDHKATWLLPKMVSYLKRTTSLVALSISDTTLSGQRCARIAAALAVNSSVENLHLPGCNLTDGDASKLVILLATNDTIRLLDLRGNAIGPAHPIWRDPRVTGGPVTNSN
ncbi:hypothetical protein [Lacisediminimonas sp.]|uniref:hypothetical protein n=1 Tax=Lacisediminimonas sp. TaxID=3060582 RepID=UPI00271A0F0A|nr:hypothetical protein [Lacisediminimonas sp.]MDO8299612.1 hypothetical protein [Lacisediminimonas sp.]